MCSGGHGPGGRDWAPWGPLHLEADTQPREAEVGDPRRPGKPKRGPELHAQRALLHGVGGGAVGRARDEGDQIGVPGGCGAGGWHFGK
eukprot:2874550-Pyramimonas_sp.AAC.1